METNYNWKYSANDIIEKIVSIEWLYERVFWKLLNKLVFDRVIDDNIHLLKEVYKMSDSDDVFIRQVERSEFKKLSNIIFRYQELSNNDNQK